MDTMDSGLPGGNAPAHWYDTWDRKTSQTFSNTAKGLRNAPGENNCFLNSAVQVFWHIDVFRRSYRRLSGHLCMGHSCIFCALKVIFTQFQYSDQASLQPSALRKALANTFAKQERFQLGHMDDAAECFENILNRIHYHIANSYNEDACNAPHCVTHQKFAMTVFDQLVCPCGATSEPLKFYEMVHYISANALVSQSRTMQESGDMLHPNRFGLLLRNAGAVGDIRDCPGNCGKRVQIRRTLLNVPDVVSIGLVWGSDKADPELSAEVTRNIGTTILFPDMFHSVMCQDASTLPRLNLTSVVCYYGKHYSTFIFHTKLQEWVYFDDATVRQTQQSVGKKWEQVVERIIRSRYQPLLLIYTNANAQPVPTETAPSTRVMAPGFSMTQGKGQEPNKERPTLPEKSQIGARVSASKIDPNQPGDGREKEPLERTSSFENRRQSSFMLAVTKQKNKEESIYAVPHNNAKVMNSQKDLSQTDPRHGYVKQSSSGSYLADIPDGPEDPESYNYTLSNSDQYRRPGLNVSDPNHRHAVTQNFSRGNEQQRKDSFKKGKGKVPADVIRYHVDGSRRSSQSSESDANSPVNETPSGPPIQSNKPALPMKPKAMNMRSQSVDENKADMPDGSNKLSHKVIKPMPSSLPVYDKGDGVTRAHTPVQSGLATLPRNKKSSNSSSSNIVSSSSSSSSLTTMSHAQSRAGSQHLAANQQYHQEVPPPPYNAHSNHPVVTGYQNCLTYQNVLDNEMHSRQSSNSSILSTGTVVECPVSDGSHTRQMSTASQDTLTDKPKEQKSKSKKKDKEERKRDESRQRKEEKKVKSRKEKNSKSDKPPVPEKKGNGMPDEGFSEEKYYIDRRMVESVLSAQKLQRSGSCLSQTSTSSMESADSYNRAQGMTPKDNLSTEIPFDAASLDSHKDSGYASSDRNSSSSTGSITMNPYEQYFLSRSMIPPKTINQQAAENMRKLMNQGPGVNGLEYTQEKDLKSLVTSPNEYYNQNYTAGHVANNPANPKSGPMQPPKDLMSLPKTERDQHLFDALSGRSKGTQPPLVPNKLQSGQQYGGQGLGQGHNGVNRPGYTCDKGMSQQQTESYGQPIQHVATRNVEPPKQSFHEGIQGGNEQFMNLSQKAEDFMDSCVLAETSEQYSQALGACQQAIDLLKSAMRMPNLSQSLYTMAQKKSNACVIKFRSLQKRLMSRQESNNSSNSSDSGIVQDFRGQQKPSSHLQVPHNSMKPPSRSSSQNSMDSQGSSCRSTTPVFDKVIRPSTDERVPPMDPHMPHAIYQNSNRDRSFDTNLPDSNMNNADLYGTLPRRKTQKSQEHMRQTGCHQHEADVYNDFLENQRRQSGNHSRTSSGARTPVNEVDFPVNYPVNSEQIYNHGDRSHYSANSAFPTGHHSGIKLIPVAPPKIENQSHHTEVGNQSKCWELPVSTGQLVHRQPTNKNISQAPCYKHSQWNVGGAFHGELINSPPVARFNLYGSRPSHVRNGNNAANTHKVSAGTIHTACSTQLQTTSANLCEPVTPETSNCYRSEKRRQLDRSASFTYNTRPSSFIQSKSNQDSSNFPCSYHLIDSKRIGESQPDLRKLSEESVNVRQRPLTPQVLCTESNEAEEGRSVSVRALTSRFETATVSGENKVEDQRSKNVQMNNFNNSHPHLTHNVSVPANLQQPSRVPLQRQRSKSESESLAQQPPRPKSVLAKKCKNSDRMNKPRKSVTFSENICLVAAAHEWGIVGNSDHVTQSGYQSDEEGGSRNVMSRISGQKVEDTDSSSSNSPVEIVGEGSCTLCHKKGVVAGHNYCINCSNYLNRFTPR